MVKNFLFQGYGFLAVVAIILVAFFIPASGALAIGPFGGDIIVLFPCVNGLKITLGPPTPGFYMYVPGTSFSYLYGPPSHPGQWLLGLSGPPLVCLVPCSSGLCPAGIGDMILFHGSSV